MKKIVIVISQIDKAIAFEWLVKYIDTFKFQLTFILLNKEGSYLEDWLIEHKIEVKRINYFSKLSLIPAIIQLYFYLARNNTSTVHCHLFEACFVGLIAGKLAGVRKRIYTRHHSTLHHIYHPKGVTYDKLFNSLATQIIAPSVVVKNVLTKTEHVTSNKITLIHHGFDISYFSHTDNSPKKYPNHYPVIGVVARYTHYKGIQYIIPAFKKLLEKYPDALLLLANSGGEYQSTITSLLNELPETSYQEIIFENEIPKLFAQFDIYIHTPVDAQLEAFGQTYVESLACGVPSIFTISGVAHEFIVDKKNALIVPYKDSNAIYEAIETLLNDEDLRKSLILNGKSDVSRLFPIERMIHKLENLYTKI